MVRLFVKYLFAIGVVFYGFQLNAFADEEKDKEDEKTSSTASKVTKNDTIIIIRVGDVVADDTLVFDDFEEDEDEEYAGDSGIALKLPSKKPRIVSCEVIPIRGCTLITTNTVHPGHWISTIESDSASQRAANAFFRGAAETPEPTKEPLSIKMYPNPQMEAFSPVTIEHNLESEVTIHIINLNGQIARSITTMEKSTPVSGLSSGMYIVTITGENQMESKKLIVQ